VSLVRVAGTTYGPQRIETYSEHVADDLARVTYTYRLAKLDQTREPWVREAGQWKQDDC